MRRGGPCYGPPRRHRGIGTGTRENLKTCARPRRGSASVGPGLDGLPVRTTDLVHGEQLVGAVAVLVELDRTRGALGAVVVQVLQHGVTLVLAPAAVADRLGDTGDNGVGGV